MIRPSKKVKIERGSANCRDTRGDTIPVELLLTIFLNGQPLSNISCLPDGEIELVIGYLINNCYIKSHSEINLLRLCEKQIRNRQLLSMSVMVETGNKTEPDNLKLTDKIKFIAPGCGSFDDIILNKINQSGKIKKPEVSHELLHAETILGLAGKTLKSQDLKNKFGGLHSAALFDWSGNCIKAYEDIGRHNCIDKISGFMATRKISPDSKLVFTTGRISLDIVFKIYMMKIPVIISNSSITHSAIFLAKKTQITAIGYARGGRFNIYAHPSRIKNIQVSK
jgi:FdhD protein